MARTESATIRLPDEVVTADVMVAEHVILDSVGSSVGAVGDITITLDVQLLADATSGDVYSPVAVPCSP